MRSSSAMNICSVLLAGLAAVAGEDFHKPYSPPCTEREDSFEFTERPKIKQLTPDRYEITFAVKGNCDVTVGIVEDQGKVVRHLASGVLGANAPSPFQKNALRQTLYWNGKDDLDSYPRQPEKLFVRVMLGLKPEFDRCLGGGSPQNIPGQVWGLVLGPDGAYVFSKSELLYLRRYDHDGRYVATLSPPPANLPEKSLAGMGVVEYERGVRATLGPSLTEAISRTGFTLPPNAHTAASCRPALLGRRLIVSTGGRSLASNAPSMLHWIHTDGSTDAAGMAGIRMLAQDKAHAAPRFAAAPDGRHLYLLQGGPETYEAAVLRRDLNAPEPATPFVGRPGKMGTDEQSLNNPVDLACDAQGRLYVADQYNNRLQIYSPQGKFLKTIPVERPTLVCVHQRTGALYVVHAARVEGRSLSRLTKFVSFDDPREEFHVDHFTAKALDVDSWTPNPRLWCGQGVSKWDPDGRHAYYSIRIYEEEKKDLRLFADFDEEAKKAAGQDHIGRWGGGIHDKVVCDPTREQLYYRNGRIFDLKSGKPCGAITFPGATDDIAFDRRGYLHAHFNPGFYFPGIGRFDPSRATPQGQRVEVPYDYGEESLGRNEYGPFGHLQGAILVKDQPGAKFFQDGIGANMRGDVAENCNIYYVPKMEEVGVELARGGINSRLANGLYVDNNEAARWENRIAALKKAGEEIYSLKRRPGYPLAGATIWTFERSGELRKECAATVGGILNGVQLDEDGSLYFVSNCTRLIGGAPFLSRRGGTHGEPENKQNRNPYTGTLIKTKPDAYCRLLLSNAIVPVEPPPDRPADLQQSEGGQAWVEEHEWLYAGASPIVVSRTCSCPTQRAHLDWYRRVYVPEAYRHSFGILDTNGNLILHLGRYGNLDSGDGPQSRIPIGGDHIALGMPRFISGTDHFIVIPDRGERLMLLKIAYHAEERVPIPGS